MALRIAWAATLGREKRPLAMMGREPALANGLQVQFESGLLGLNVDVKIVAREVRHRPLPNLKTNCDRIDVRSG
jgi:hypothetical protein